MADRIPTFADVCSAIAEGSLAATVDGAMYQVNVFELRRFLNQFRSLPPLPYTNAQVTTLDADSSPWSDGVRTSVA
jgi:hypothetical protein